jgi:hypothetical protein
MKEYLAAGRRRKKWRFTADGKFCIVSIPLREGEHHVRCSHRAEPAPCCKSPLASAEMCLSCQNLITMERVRECNGNTQRLGNDLSREDQREAGGALTAWLPRGFWRQIEFKIRLCPSPAV